MAYLLDTNVVLRALKYPDRLGKQTTAIVTKEECYISVASVWEIIIKVRAGKLRVPLPAKEVISLLGAKELPIALAHVDKLMDIKLPHKDPFDWILTAQSKVEKLTLVTSDQILLDGPYDVFNSKL